jgi:hypothetical protein
LTAEDPDGFGTEEESASRPLSGSPSDLIEFNLSMPEPRKNGARRLSQKHAAKRRVRLRRQIRRSSYAVATRREGHRSPRSDREVQRQRGKLSNTSAWLRRLLRPRRCRAAEQRDELAAFQLIELHSVPASSPRKRGMESRRPWPRRRRHPARRFANGRPRSSLMMQPAGKVSPLPRCPIKSDQERKRREKKEIASCRQHRT